MDKDMIRKSLFMLQEYIINKETMAKNENDKLNIDFYVDKKNEVTDLINVLEIM